MCTTHHICSFDHDRLPFPWRILHPEWQLHVTSYMCMKQHICAWHNIYASSTFIGFLVRSGFFISGTYMHEHICVWNSIYVYYKTYMLKYLTFSAFVHQNRRHNGGLVGLVTHNLVPYFRRMVTHKRVFWVYSNTVLQTPNSLATIYSLYGDERTFLPPRVHHLFDHGAPHVPFYHVSDQSADDNSRLWYIVVLYHFEEHRVFVRRYLVWWAKRRHISNVVGHDYIQAHICDIWNIYEHYEACMWEKKHKQKYESYLECSWSWLRTGTYMWILEHICVVWNIYVGEKHNTNMNTNKTSSVKHICCLCHLINTSNIKYMTKQHN